MSSQELVEVVSKYDSTVGQTVTVKEAHEKRLPHRVAAVHVFSPDGRLYVQVRNEAGFRRDHTVGGHVDAGETYLEAAEREMYEEINLRTPLKFIISGISEDYESIRTAKAHVFGVYSATAPLDWKFTPNDEVADLLLMEVDEILKDMENCPDHYTHGFRKTLEAYIDWKKSDE